MSGLAMPDGVISVDNEVRGIDVVAFCNHLEHLGLVNCTFFHKLDDFVLMGDSVINVVVQLDLDFVFELTGLVHEILVLWDWCKVLTILG